MYNLKSSDYLPLLSFGVASKKGEILVDEQVEATTPHLLLFGDADTLWSGLFPSKSKLCGLFKAAQAILGKLTKTF